MDTLLKELAKVRHEIVNMLDMAFDVGLITQKERDIFYFRHIEWNSLDLCGKKFGVTRERIRQIEAKVLEKFRQAHKHE